MRPNRPSAEMGKDDPIGRRDPFAQKIIAIDGISLKAVDAPQVSPIAEFTPTSEEVADSLDFSEKDSAVLVNNTTAEKRASCASTRLQKSRGSGTPNRHISLESANGSGSAIDVESSGKERDRVSKDVRLTALPILETAGKKRALSPTLRGAKQPQKG